MSASNEWTEWHLTPQGWERGSEKEDFTGINRKPTPDGCVMTVVHRERIASSFSGIERSDETSWTSPDTKAVEALLAKFGKAPTSL